MGATAAGGGVGTVAPGPGELCDGPEASGGEGEGPPAPQTYLVTGGRPLKGRLRVQGAKNAILPLLAACLLATEPCLLLDAPRLSDVAAMVAILRHLGATVRSLRLEGIPALAVDPRGVTGHEVPDHLMRRLRSSIFVMGPLLARLGRARLSLPGGCDIGPRPVDFHLRGLEALGARIREDGGGMLAEAGHLQGAEIYLDQPSVGATENVMLAATGARGTTVIRNAAREPEVVDLQVFLNRLGAHVTGAGDSVITVHGPVTLGGGRHEVVPDRIEAGTWLMATGVTGGDLTLSNVVPEHIGALRAKLREAGFAVEALADGVRLRAAGRPVATNVQTQPYPGFPTDLQNVFMALLLTAKGTSFVTETIFDNRFRVVNGFVRMGAQISTYGRVAVVNGVPRLTAAAMEGGLDLRGAAALVVAALGAEGTSVVTGVECLERGYQGFAERLRTLGADVRVERS